MDAVVKGIVDRVKELLASIRAWAMFGANGISLPMLDNDWAKAAVLAATAVAYILSDTWVKTHTKPTP